MRVAYRNFPKSYEVNELTKLRNKIINANKIILDLPNSNPSFQGLSPDLNQFSNDFLENGDQYNPQPCGKVSAREAVAQYYVRRFDKNHSSEYGSRIILTSSTSEAYTWLFKLLCERNDKVIIPQPGYPLCEDIVRLERINVLNYYLLSNSGKWVVDRDSVMHGIATGAQVLVVINPHSPTGTYLSYNDLSWIGKRCAEYGLYLIIDEVFADYAWNKLSSISSLRYDQMPCLTFVLNGLSKTLALPHLKCSWILVFGSGKIVEEIISHLEFLGDTYLPVNSLVQNAIPKLLLQQEEIQKPIIDRLQINLSSMENILPNWGSNLQACSGGWWVLYSLPKGVDDNEFSIELLGQKHTLVHPGYLFGLKEGYIALSLITKPEVFTKGLKLIAELIIKF